MPHDLEILGFPVVELQVAADRPCAQLALRLCDVAPDGSSLRVSYAVLNLAHRDGSAEPKPLVPNGPVRVRLPLKVCGPRFRAGPRIPHARSTAYWPLAWPALDAATLTVTTGRSRLGLPVRRARRGEAEYRFPAPRHGAPAPQTRMRDSRLERRTSFDLLDGIARYVTVSEGGLFGEGVVRWDEIGTTVSHDLTRRLSVGAADPLSARARIEQTYRLERLGWLVRIETVAELTADAERFRIVGTMKVFEGDTPVRTREWTESIRRNNL